jgi:choice-of-anchor B domain-containing protein
MEHEAMKTPNPVRNPFPSLGRAALAACLALSLAVALPAAPARAGGLELDLGGHEAPPEAPGDPGAASSTVPCVDGRAGIYPCHDVDLVAFLPRDELGLGAQDVVNDMWGWTDPASGVEYALVGTSNGTAFVSLEDAAHPRWLGTLPTRSFAAPWRDLKVYRDHAFVVADVVSHGMQVFDLTRLRGVAGPQTFTADAQYVGPGLGAGAGFALGNAHNIALDEETGFAYVVGSNTCAGGLHMVDVRDPRRPRFAGCSAATGYIHDTECVVYRGPDGRYQGRELCFNANADALSIHDVTDKRAPAVVARTTYPGLGYVHQAWLTDDQRYLLVDDELDEVRFGHPTRTYVWDVRSLDAPRLVGWHDSTSPATDHNLYVRGHYVYQANYFAGLRILEMEQIENAVLTEVAYFDTTPEREEVGFGGGAWNVYPFLDSGLVLVTSIGEGLFVLRPTLHAGEDGAQDGGAAAPPGNGEGEPAPPRVVRRRDG